MQQKPIKFSSVINFIGLAYLILVSVFFYGNFRNVFNLLMIILFLIGDFVFVLYTIYRPYNQIITKISNWIYAVFIFLLEIFLILILIFRNSDEPLIIIISYFIMIFGFILILILSLNEPNENSMNETEETTSKEKILILSSFLIMIALFVSPIITFIYLYVMPYGVDEGIIYFLFVSMIQLSFISFIPVLGFSKRFKNKQISIMDFSSKIYKKMYFILLISSLIVLITTIVPLIISYEQDKIVAFNAIIYHILFAGILVNLFYLYFIVRQKDNTPRLSKSS